MATVSPVPTGLFKNRLARIVFAILLLGGIFTAGIVWSSLDNVEQRRAYRAAIDQAGRLSAKNGQIRDENERLKASIAKFERQLQVNQIAYEKLTSQLSESSSYINELREDLDFYQSIISPQDNKAGVRIQAIQIARPQNLTAYRYRLTVVQALKHETSVSGKASIFLEGINAGQEVMLDITKAAELPSKLTFRYFQILEGRFELPGGFEPTGILVKVVSTPAGKSKKSEIERRFNWTVSDNEWRT